MTKGRSMWREDDEPPNGSVVRDGSVQNFR